MTTHTFTFKELLRFGWEKTVTHAWFLFCLGLLLAVMTAAVNRMELLELIVGLVTGIIVVAVSLVIVEGKTPTYHDVLKSFKGYSLPLRFTVASVLYALAVGIGLIVLIIPGVYLAVRLQFYKYLIVAHEHMTPIQAFKESMRMTDGKFWKLLGVLVLFIVVNITGAIPFGLGLIVTLPVTILASAHLYKKLELHTSAVVEG